MFFIINKRLSYFLFKVKSEFRLFSCGLIFGFYGFGVCWVCDLSSFAASFRTTSELASDFALRLSSRLAKNSFAF